MTKMKTKRGIEFRSEVDTIISVSWVLNLKHSYLTVDHWNFFFFFGVESHDDVRFIPIILVPVRVLTPLITKLPFLVSETDTQRDTQISRHPDFMPGMDSTTKTLQ